MTDSKEKEAQPLPDTPKELPPYEGKRKLMIVIEDAGGPNGRGYNMYLEGDKERIISGVPQEELGPAEFWASRLFSICVDVVGKAGGITSKTDRATGKPV